MKKINLGDNAIMFGDITHCSACKEQDALLKKHFKNGNYLHKHVSLNKLPYKIKGYTINAVPTWYIPSGDGSGYFKVGVIKTKLKSLLEKKKSKKSFRFGQSIPQIGTWARDGKNFPDGKGFNVNSSWYNDIANTWGDVTLAGTLGREFGPGKVDTIYSNNYYNGIRMAYPGGDLDTALSLNRTASMYNPNPTPTGANSYPVNYSPGLIYNSPNPQIVSMTAFGKKRKKNRFGKDVLYQMMGPIPPSNYVLNANKYYAGGGQNEPTRPPKGSNNNLYINKFAPYNPVQSITNFGLKQKQKAIKKLKKLKKEKVVKHDKEKVVEQKKNVKIKGTIPKEGSTLTVSFGRIKVS